MISFPSNIPLGAANPEQRLWMECLLAKCCLLETRSTFDSGASATDLAPFRAWADFWNGRPSQGLTKLETLSGEPGVLRRHVWKAYYDRLSSILQQGLPYESPVIDNSEKPEHGVSSRMRQRIELKNVQTVYEGILLTETRFPKADEVNEEVGDWVEQTMRNWTVLCGPSWRDDELGEGGQEAVGRDVLDVSCRLLDEIQHINRVPC